MKNQRIIEEYLSNLKRESELGRIDLVENYYGLIKTEADNLSEEEKRGYITEAEAYLEDGYKRWIGTALLRIAYPIPYGYYESTYNASLEKIVKVANGKGIKIPEGFIEKIESCKIREEIEKYFPLAEVVPKNPDRKRPSGFVF